MVDGIATDQIATLDDQRKGAILNTLDANFLGKTQGFIASSSQDSPVITNDFVEKSKNTKPAPEETKAKVRDLLNQLKPSQPKVLLISE